MSGRDSGPPAEAMFRLVSIDRNSPVPLWYQLAQAMQEAIQSGSVPSGSQLDNELSLSRRLNVSRPTVRRAMEHLVDRGLVVRQRGVGTRVVQQKVQRPLALTSLYDDLRSTGQQPATTLLAHDTVESDAEVAAALEIAVGTPVRTLTRLRRAGDQPIAQMCNYLPVGLAEIDIAALETGGLYELLRAQGVVLHAATQSIGARRATAAEARALAEQRGAALLTMQRTAYDDHGRPIEFGRHIYAASRYVFHTQLIAAFG